MSVEPVLSRAPVTRRFVWDYGSKLRQTPMIEVEVDPNKEVTYRGQDSAVHMYKGSNWGVKERKRG